MENIIYSDQLLDTGEHPQMTQVQHIQISNQPLQTISTLKLEEVPHQQVGPQGQRFITLRIDGQNRQVIQTFNPQQLTQQGHAELLLSGDSHQEIMVQTIPEQTEHQQHVQLQAVIDQHSGNSIIPSQQHLELQEEMSQQSVTDIQTHQQQQQQHIQLQEVITSQALDSLQGQQQIQLQEVMAGQQVEGMQGQQIELHEVMEDQSLDVVQSQQHMELQQVIQGQELENVAAQQGIEIQHVIKDESVVQGSVPIVEQHELELPHQIQEEPQLEDGQVVLDIMEKAQHESGVNEQMQNTVPQESLPENVMEQETEDDDCKSLPKAEPTEDTEEVSQENNDNPPDVKIPTEAEMEDLQFEAQLKKLEGPGPQFVMGPPSVNSGDEEDEMDTSLIKGIVKGESNGTGIDEDIDISYDSQVLPQYEFKDLIENAQTSHQTEEEEVASDEGIVKDQVVIKKEKVVAKVPKKRHSIISVSTKKVKARLPLEDPQLLMDVHELYNKLCIFCHSNHSEKCLIYDPMEKYEDIDQVGPPYTYGMPDQILMGLSRVYEGSYSLFARDDIPAFTQFGPLKGRIVEEAEFRKISLLEIDIENFWPIEASEHDELMIDNWLDTSDVEISNWLKFLLPESPRRNSSGYNVQRITKGGEIYFVTTEHILSGEELFMRAMEPPYRVYHNLKEMKRTEFLCGLNHTYKHQGNEVLNLENMVYFVRHHLFVHSIQPGVFGAAYIYDCPVCGEDCYTKEERLNHMNDNHKDEENIKTILKRDRRCYYCKKSFTTQAMLGHHIKYNHPKDEEVAAGYECPVCKARVKTKPTLRKHMQESHLPINVSCDICGKVLKNKGTLKVHMMKIHAKKGMKQCILCEKTFSDLYQLRVHSLTHNKLRPFECKIEICDQTFTTKQCLQKHYRIKHGLKDAEMPAINRNINVQDMPAYH